MRVKFHLLDVLIHLQEPYIGNKSSLTQADRYLVDCISTTGAGILILLAGHGGAVGYGI